VATIGAVATVGLLAGPAAAGASPAGGAHRASVVTSAGPLSDLSPSTVDPTDGATAAALAVGVAGTGSLVALHVRGMATSAAGTTYGAHVHVGPCVAGNGAAAGPHYNSTGAATVDETTEVWLDFTVRADGSGSALALVPFVVPAGAAQSIVIHAMPTSPTGAAGPRLACLPLPL
jgi:Cu/Zn superoxide dismutase